MWNLRIVIDPYSLDIGYDDPGIEADLVLVTHEHGDHNNVALVAGNVPVVRGLNRDKVVGEMAGVLDRHANQPTPTWQLRTDDSPAASPNAVSISAIAAWHDNSNGGERGATAMFVIDVDGVRIVHCGDLGQHTLTNEQLERVNAGGRRVDVLLIPVGGVYTIDGAQAARIVEQVRPRFAIPIHYKTDVLHIPLESPEKFLKATQPAHRVSTVQGNTLAVAKSLTADGDATTVVALHYRPHALPAELTKLLDAKEQACRESQQVFAELSATQMNFRPANGTHTPRWNAEHMMGRELLFFSQIYHQLDPSLPVIDLNPKQMPADYLAAHPDWTGAEEARQIERVSDYTRRYSYLLSELPLDEKAPGSFWTPRKLLRQMDKHYREHTANVRAKFDLDDWPTQ
jgi:L-ascorbate metabolism protein UlaG (beta-lactamase superfamily)